MQSHGSFKEKLSQETTTRLEESFSTRRATNTYPVLTLPPEIVAEIFLNFIPTYPESASLLGSLSPVVLCQICRHWRAIALSTPTLWRAIRIDIHNSRSDKTLPAQLEFVKAWLSRSGECSLSINLSDFSNLPLGNQFLQTLLLHCSRWEHADLLVPLEHFSLLQAADMPLLQELKIGPNDLPDTTATTVSIFDRSLRLTHVVLTEDFVPSVIRLPWAQLTHLTGLCLFEHECTEILSCTTQLVRATITVFGSSQPYSPPPNVLELPHLRHLILFVRDIAIASGVCLWKILDNCTLPALRTLWLSGACISVESIAALLARSQCILEELHITNADLSEFEYREVLPPVGQLTLNANE
ncbi:hypothetical protein B0H19DRAFT_1103753 [Mycena capillaripes]|nr:hypothetical protein B0H19DRAFT_1103753 [Mycena capillaripes]